VEDSWWIVKVDGGGGAGGFREYKSPVTPYTASPLDGILEEQQLQ
jgi:hypothetical protein